MRLRVAVAFCLGLPLLLAGSPLPARSCAVPPQVQYVAASCRLVVSEPVVFEGQSVSVEFTVTNLGDPAGAEFFDDLPVVLWMEHQPVSDCGDPGLPDGIRADPYEEWVWLDDATSPHADTETTVTRSFVTGPLAAGTHLIEGFARNDGGTRLFSCSVRACIEVIPRDQVLSAPHAEFLEPVHEASGGEAVPFRLRILRNGYPSGRPLIVRVVPANAVDELDVFPVAPPGLATTGTLVTGDDEVLDFSCNVHGPCYVGVSNEYHVTIHDEETLLWSSAWSHPSGLGRVVVAHAPLARTEILEILDDTGDGQLMECEHGFVRVRLSARNPFRLGELVDGRMVLPLPPELTLISQDLHLHDNPIDAETPSAADLAHGATVTVGATTLTIDFDPLPPREVVLPIGPLVFQDLLDVDLLFETPPDGLGAAGVTLPGLTVSGSAMGTDQLETSADLRIDTIPNTLPQELWLLPDFADGLSWDTPTSNSSSVDVYRGAITELHDRRTGSCFAEDQVANILDPETPPSSGWFYLVTGRNCHGRGAGVGRASDGPRPDPESCP